MRHTAPATKSLIAVCLAVTATALSAAAAPAATPPEPSHASPGPRRSTSRWTPVS
ncbi:hypothetical protein [Streptomyces sp. Ac-502]|uniref:hypothetical protein n=1 Tax=Streptomyces sp. Ac-502 TaxID=3342801 RepID=UPI0038628DF4